VLDLNSAGADELQLLEGIGPVLAARIIADRQKNGPYRSVNDLARVPGIGPRTIEKVRPLVTVR
jgi:competence protein ComEA